MTDPEADMVIMLVHQLPSARLAATFCRVFRQYCTSHTFVVIPEIERWRCVVTAYQHGESAYARTRRVKKLRRLRAL